MFIFFLSFSYSESSYSISLYSKLFHLSLGFENSIFWQQLHGKSCAEHKQIAGGK